MNWWTPDFWTINGINYTWEKGNQSSKVPLIGDMLVSWRAIQVWMTITYNEKEREGMTMNNHNVHTLPVKRMPDNLTPNPLCVLQNIQGNPPSWSYPHFLGGIHVVTTSLGFAAMSRVQGRLHLDPSSRSVKKRPLTGAICEVPGVGPQETVGGPIEMVWA